MSYNPVIAIFIFLGISLIIFLFFRPEKGWYFMFKNKPKKDKTVLEDILKNLYRNQSSGNTTTTNNLITTLPFSHSVIIKNIEKMIADGLILLHKDTYELTEKGKEYALQIIRAHRLWEKYLSEKTGFHKNEWHQRAEQKEHELNYEELERLSHLLGNPKFDPHGDPIPTSKGHLPQIDGLPLTLLKEKSLAKIIHIEDEPNIIYRKILEKNIHLHSIIKIIENSNDRIVFYSEGQKFTISPLMAGNITVSKIEELEKKVNIHRLSNLKLNEKAVIVGLSKECRGENRRRLLDLGFVPGSEIEKYLPNPFDEPNAYIIKDTVIALRNEQADKVLIKKKNDETKHK